MCTPHAQLYVSPGGARFERTAYTRKVSVTFDGVTWAHDAVSGRKWQAMIECAAAGKRVRVRERDGWRMVTA